MPGRRPPEDDPMPKANQQQSRTAQETEKEAEEKDVEERSSPRTPVIYETVRRHGEEEMERPSVSLWWSGLAAGLSISFSLLAQAELRLHVPDSAWRPLIVAAGYPVGFLMVVLARQQLFTETTITAILPVLAKPSRKNIANVTRMWSIVFVANMAGTLAAALFCMFTPVLAPDTREAMLALSRESMANGWLEMFFKAITAGFLIATMVWLLPAAEAARFHVVALMTYLIAIGDSMHIVAGSVEAFLLVAHGELGVWAMLGGFTVPVLLGNVVGGTALFAMLSYAQVMQEI